MTDKYPPEYWAEMIDEIMDEFDFDKVHRCMVALDWQWARLERIPEKPEIRKSARQQLRDAVERGCGGTGGFRVMIDRKNGVLTLSFVVEEWDAYEDETTNGR